MSVCQRSAQGAKAPQRPPAKQAEPLTAHHRIEKRLADAGRFFVTAARVRTRKGAELRKRMSVCQRSAQGAKAPQRPPAKQAEPLTAHPKIVETVNFGWPSFLLPVHGFEPVSIYI